MSAPTYLTTLSTEDRVLDAAFQQAEIEWAETLEWLKDK